MLEVHGLCYTYPGGVKAVNNVSFSAEPGSKVFFHGPNGAGKSTLFQCINGLFQPDAGQIRLDGVPIPKSKKRMQRIGIVFQNPEDQLICGSVYEEVAFGPLHMGLDPETVRSRVKWAMDALRIGHLKDRPPHLLSFGQKRSVTIAAVVSMGQDILLLDEPTAGLDPRQSAELTAVLDQLAAQGKTLLISTHDVALSYHCADKIAILDAGSLFAFDTPDVVFSNRELLARTGLPVPPAFAVYHALLQKGLLPPSAVPHNLAQLLELIDAL